MKLIEGKKLIAGKKLIVYIFMFQAAILMISGNVWNDSILVYLFGLFLFKFLNKLFDESLDRKTIFYAIILDIFILFFSILNMLKNQNMDFANPLSYKIVMKILVIAAGGYFLSCMVIRIFFMIQMDVNRSYQLIFIPAYMICSVYCLNVQQIVTYQSVFGCLFAYFAVASFYLYLKNLSRRDWSIVIGSIIFAAIFTFGYLEEISRSLSVYAFNLKMTAILFVAFIFWLTIWIPALSFIFKGLEWLQTKIFYDHGYKKSTGIWVIPFSFLCWLPYFLNYYPGLLSSDSISQLTQAMGLSEVTNHHPWIHTMIMKLCYLIGMEIEGSAIAGVAIYSIGSMLFLSVVYAFVYRWLMKQSVRKEYALLTIAFYLLIPINAVYSITMWKDIIFAGIMVLYILFLYNACGERCKIDTSFTIKFILLSILVCTFRSNGFYVWIFTSIFVIWSLRDQIKKIILITMCVLSLFILYKGNLSYLQIPNSDTIESLSIPAQQIAYTIAEQGDISDKEYELLGKIVDSDQVGAVYLPYISDPIKHVVREKNNQKFLHENQKEYLKLYLSIGLKNPYKYTIAYINQTNGYWFHKVNNWIYYQEALKENDLGISRKCFLPPQLSYLLEKALKISENIYHRYFSIAMQTYLLIILIFYSLKRKNTIAMFMPLAGVVLTLLAATPVAAEFRYTYSLFLAMPVLPVMALALNHNQLEQNILSESGSE